MNDLKEEKLIKSKIIKSQLNQKNLYTKILEKKRKELNAKIKNNRPYNEVYEISVELDDIVTKYLENDVGRNKKDGE